MAKKTNRLNPSKLTAAIKSAAKRAFTEVRKSNKGETFYAFALYTDEDFATVEPSCNSEEKFEERIRSEGRKLKPSHVKYVRWGTAEWAYEGAGGEHFAKAYELIKSGSDFTPSDTNLVLAAMVDALKSLDEEEFFGAGPDRERVTLFISVSDSESAEMIENTTAKQLNPPVVYKKFLQRNK